MRLLAITPNWLGDMVMSAALFQSIKAQAPAVEITALGPAFARPLLERLDAVDRVIDSPFGHGGLNYLKRRQFGRTLPAFDAAVVLPNSFKSALIPWMAGIPTRVGWLGEQRYGVLTARPKLNKAEFPRMVDRYLELARPLGFQPTFAEPRMTAGTVHLSIAGDYVVLAPGAAFGSAKRWPADRYAQVALNLLAQGNRVLLIGGPGEVDDCAQIANAQPPAYRDRITNLAGQASLGESLDLIGAAGAVVANDSGLMHVAAAMGVPLVGIFGPTSPDHTPPLSAKAQVVWSKPACAPCFKRVCPLKHHQCMNELAPGLVVDALAKYV
ncbi:lipopolysaccharide heptosyltransferase II [Litorivicinus lipolyticus]|uniref:lipopolysaccharide heptosyltransferase II n=1 Tax=Litorivicinus lipolyticus TaxID=418701 RepID=UPI003B59B8F7